MWQNLKQVNIKAKCLYSPLSLFLNPSCTSIFNSMAKILTRKCWLPWWYADNEQMVRSCCNRTTNNPTQPKLCAQSAVAGRLGGCSSTTPDGYLGTACPNNRWWTDGYITTCHSIKFVVRQWQKYQSRMFTDMYNVYISDSPKCI